jgi:hypothetical protein
LLGFDSRWTYDLGQSRTGEREKEWAMKEKDIRDRINAFLRTRMQNLVVPASMGLGLALSGCGGTPMDAHPGAGGAPTSFPSSGGIAGAAGGIYGYPASGAGGSAGTASGGIAGGAGGIYGFPASGGTAAGGSATGGTAGGLGGVYGFPASGGTAAGGSGGTLSSGLTGAGGTVYGSSIFRSGGISNSGGISSGGIRGTGGTVYGTGGFADAGPSGGGGKIDTAGSESGDSSDAQVSEAGLTAKDLPSERRDARGTFE